MNLKRSLRSPLRPAALSPLQHALIAGGVTAPARTYPASFNILLSSPVGATIADGTGVVTINNNPIVPSFTMTRTTGVAPLGVHFDASGTTAPTLTSKPFHELYYAWSFGDPAGGATWAYGTRPGVASKNTAYGPIAAHVFETPGTYTATLWVYHLDSGGTLRSASKVGSTSITVTDPDVVFDTAHTIYVSQSTTPTPGANGVPSGANVLNMPNWSTLKTLVGTNGYRRIRLMRGDTWNVDAWADFPNATWNGPGLIDAFGTGAKPIVQSDIDAPCFRFGSTAVTDWRVVDVVATSAGTTGGGNQRAFAVGGKKITLLRVETGPCTAGLMVGGTLSVAGDYTSGVTEFYVVDSYIGPSANRIGSISAYCDSVGYQAHMGNRYTGSYEHSCRWQGTRKSVFTNNTADTPTAGRNGHCFTLRGYANSPTSTWVGVWTEDVVVSDNVFDGSVQGGALPGFEPLAIKPQSSTNHAERLRNVICERNFSKSSGTHPGVTLEVAENLTFRNNIVQLADGNYGIIVAGNNALSPAPVGTALYNNIIYKPSAAVSAGFSAIVITDALPTGTVMKNNVAYAPGCLNNSFSASPPALFKTTQTGGNELTHTATNNSVTGQITGSRPWAATTPATYADFTPSASYAVDSGVYVPIVVDFFATQITGTRDMGAIQA